MVEKSFFEDLTPHLKELGQRLIYILVLFLAVFIFTFINYSPVLEWITEPLKEALKSAGDLIAIAKDGKITTHKVGGTLSVIMSVSMFIATIISVPLIFWQIWAFVSPGLYEHEREPLKGAFPYFISGTILFLMGIAFVYYIMMPYTFTFLLTFGAGENFIPLIDIENYVGGFISLMLIVGTVFTFPTIMAILAKLDLITDEVLTEFFRYAVVIIFIISAIITPPDVLSQIIVAIPLIILYGISIFVVKFINPKEKI